MLHQPSDLALAKQDTMKGTLVLIRQAARNPSERKGGDGLLTARGHDAARLWGSMLPPDLFALAASPVTRCQQTAAAIAAGWSATHGQETPFVKTDSRLAIIHHHQTDPDAVRRQLDRTSYKRFVAQWREGNVEGLPSLTAVADPLLEDLVPPADSPCLIAVTHDFTVAAIAAHLQVVPTRWPRPLEGLVIRWKPNGFATEAPRGWLQ